MALDIDALETSFDLLAPRGEERVVLFGLCGHGHFDLSAYEDFLAGRLDDPEFSDADLRRALDALPQGVPALG